MLRSAHAKLAEVSCRVEGPVTRLVRHVISKGDNNRTLGTTLLSEAILQ